MNLAKLNTKAALTWYSSTVCAVVLVVASTAAVTKADLHPEIMRMIVLSKPECDLSNNTPLGEAM